MKQATKQATATATATTKKQAVKQVTKKTVIVAEGKTGKQLTAYKVKLKANQANKDELTSLSFQFKQVKKHGKDFLKVLKITASEYAKINVKTQLLTLRTEKEVLRMDKNGGKVTYWLFISLIERYAKNKTKK